MKKKKSLRADVLLLLLMLGVGGVIALVLLLTSHQGAYVRVKVGDQVQTTFPLQENTEYQIPGVDGGTNDLVIRDGQAWLVDASCPDKLCVNMGRISKKGQSIICLPNQVVIEIADDNDTNSDSVDAVTG